jgi:hypothetical protein
MRKQTVALCCCLSEGVEGPPLVEVSSRRQQYCHSSLCLSPSQEYFLQAELTSNVLKTGVVHCCVGQCNNTIPVDTILTMKKLPITYVRSLWELSHSSTFSCLCVMCLSRFWMREVMESFL